MKKYINHFWSNFLPQRLQKVFLTMCTLCMVWFTSAQTTTENFVKTTTYKGAGATLPVIQVTYFDGLGRPIQQIANAQSNSGKDIVTHTEYDAYGRMPKEFLPYANTTPSLNYNSNAGTEVGTFYNTLAYENTLNPYSEKQFEASPLNRVLKQAAPGNAWKLGSNHEIRLDYQTNTSTTEVKKYTITSTFYTSKGLFDNTISDNGYFPINQLYKTITKDENWTTGDNNTTQEFKNKEGQVVLKRTFNNNIAHDTYYVYDIRGNLSFVIPPLADGIVTQTTLDGLCYQYKYDYRNRLAAKKLPGKQWEYIVYDKLDKPVATGPAFSPWGDGTVGILITQYDVFSRVTQTGWKAMIITETTRSSWQNDIMTGTNPFVLSENDILTKNYYDNYTYPNAPNLPTTLPDSTYPIAQNVKGLATGSWVRVLTLPSETIGETSYTFYDDKYRPVRTYTQNHLGGYTQVDSKLDFIGKANYTKTTHKRVTADTEILIKDSFTYSAQDRLLLHKQQINALPEQLIASNTYDELGQLTSKNVGGVDATGVLGLQKVDYSYNIRGWLKSINDVTNLSQGATVPQDLFAFRLSYNNPAKVGVADLAGTPLYNGNISETYWKTNSDNVLRKYSYEYDKLNRLLDANYYKPEITSTFNNYNESVTGYDKNGNIIGINRNGDMDSDGDQLPNPIDQLVYKYDTANKNQLVQVLDKSLSPKGFNETQEMNSGDSNGITDATDDYTYDANGNMLTDTNKGISEITYNHLNLPTKIIINDQKINYIYNALGQKVQKTTPEIINGEIGTALTTTDYMAGGFQYKNGLLLFFPHPEGYVNVLGEVGNSGNKYNYVYNYTDHLGNIRLSYTNDPATGLLKILEENHYYPFGLKHSNYNSDRWRYIKVSNVSKIKPPPPAEPLAYQYKYNGKEFQDELGLNMYDYGARLYDPARAGWSNIDPKAETSRRWSPYNYCYNNPMRFVDPDGMQAYDPGDKFATKRAAAMDFAKLYNGISIINNVELKSAVYQMKDGSFSYTVPEGYINTDAKGENKTAAAAGAPVTDVPDGTTKKGDLHSHAADRDGRPKLKGTEKTNSGDNEFSDPDKDSNRAQAKETKDYAAYVSTPNGTVIEHDPYVKGEALPKGNTVNVINQNNPIPSDPKSPTRVGNVSPNVTPNVMPNIYVNGALNPAGGIKTKFYK